MWGYLEKVKNVEIKFLFAPTTPQIRQCVGLIMKVVRLLPYFNNRNTIICRICVLSIHILNGVT